VEIGGEVRRVEGGVQRVHKCQGLLSASNGLSLEGDNIYVGAKSNVFVTASNNDFVVNANSNIRLAASNGDLTITKLAGGAAGTVTLANYNGGATVSATGPAALLSTAAAVQVTASQALSFTSQHAEVSLSAASNASYDVGTINRHIFMVGGVEVLSIMPNTNQNRETDFLVKFMADVEMKGTTNSINVTESNLDVQDKLIRLAYNVDGAHPIDGVANEGAGIFIDGVPSVTSAGVANSNDTAGYYEKSLTWHKNGTSDDVGVQKVGAAWVSDTAGPAASFWQLSGGDFRITKKYDATVRTLNNVDRVAGDSVSYGFRVNEFEELEFYKCTKNASGSTYKRVSKFGREMFAA
jgi:hypothetical protein